MTSSYKIAFKATYTVPLMLGLLSWIGEAREEMNVPAVGANSMAAPMQAARAYTLKPAGQEEVETKEITTEQIQAMLDENSNLIVEIITLNNQLKQAKGTGQHSEITDKLDKKRKKLNKNLMTLAKWADESSDQPPRPPPAAYGPPQQYAARAMAMNPMGVPQQMAMGHAQMQMPRYNPAAQAQMQAQAMAQAQYHARMSSMGGHAAYGGMPAGGPRYHDPVMGYGAMAPGMARPMAMAMPPGYVGGAPMGYPMAAPHGYGMMAPPQGMQRVGGAPDSGASAPGGANPDIGRSS